jgi:hypothetical protein
MFMTMFVLCLNYNRRHGNAAKGFTALWVA